ncbi:MAG: secondary thiamine-phosphate synthase enzyme YjbQ [Elusimicrobiales bacterium]
MKQIIVKTSSSQQAVDITDKIFDAVKESGVENGVCFVYNPHTTAALFINEGADPSVRQDIIDKLNSLISPNEGYKHLEGNSHAHIKSAIIGNSIFLIVENSKPVLGRWQSVYLFDADGPRTRSVYVKVIEG